MEKKKINPIISNVANTLLPKLLLPTIEYNKENLIEPSYIFAPNHTNNLDGYLIWSLLSQNYDIDTFMFKEFWDDFPTIAKLLPLVHVYPITRDKLIIDEFKSELQKLKDKSHSLVIFPQGRHVDPNIMLNFPEYHINTLPLGAFYFAAISKKSIMPVYMEPQKFFGKNVVIYGKAINPNDYVVKGNMKSSLLNLAQAWLNEINELYIQAIELEKRHMRQYPLHKNYFDASGTNSNLSDPNIVGLYLEEVKRMEDLSKSTNITDVKELGELLNIPKEIIEKIEEAQEVYKTNLLRR